MDEEAPNFAVKPPFRAGLGEAGAPWCSSPVQWKVSPEDPLKGVCALRVEIRPRAQDEEIMGGAACGVMVERQAWAVVVSGGGEGRPV
jgi:hypothetical protein